MRPVLAVPQLPLVHRAVPRVVRVHVEAARPRARRRVRAVRVELRDDAREEVGVVPEAPRAAVEALVPAPVVEAPDVLVAAVPQHERRVVPEAHDVVARLGLDLGAQRLLLRVGRAGEEEVLPGEDAPLVAQVVEVVRLVDPAAPHAQEVQVRGDRLVDPCGVPLARDAVRERVVRDPVRPAHPDGHPVDDEPEGRAVLVGLHLERRGAEADAAGGRVEVRALGQQLDDDVVERLVTVRPRPPQVHLGHDDVDLHRVGVGRHLDPHPGDGRREGERRGTVTGPGRAGALDLRDHAHAPGRGRQGLARLAHDRRVDAHLGETRDRPGLEPHRAPDPGRRGVGAPVPAEAARHLAHRVERVLVDLRPVAQEQALPVGVRDGGREPDRELVLPLDEQRADVEPVGAVHVRRGADDRAVQPDLRDGVEAVEDEVVPLVPLRRPRETGGVHPVGPADPREQPLVVVEVRVGDQPGGQEVGVHAPGHRGRDVGDDRPRGDGPRAGAHRPAVVQLASGRRGDGGGGEGHLVAPAVRPL